MDLREDGQSQLVRCNDSVRDGHNDIEHEPIDVRTSGRGDSGKALLLGWSTFTQSVMLAIR